MTAQPVEYGDRDVAMTGEILRGIVGSGAHGVAIAGTDDRDEMGVYIEPPEHVTGIGDGNPDHRDDYVSRTVPEGHRSGPGDTDLVLYSLRKYLRLAVVGNPTVLLPLWVDESTLLVQTDLGAELRGLRDAFMTKRAVHRFLGYMESQHERMMGTGKRNRVPKRPELVDAHGWDTKYGSHALRLAIEGHEVATTGALTLPLADDHRDLVLAVKRGEHSRDTVSSWVQEYRDRTEAVLHGDCALPPEPDWLRISEFSHRAHLAHWAATGR